MKQPDLYFDWLCTIVGAGPDEHYQDRYKLLNYLFRKEFTWSVMLDKNRAADGLDLRLQYQTLFNCEINMPDICSCLEVMVALSNAIEQYLQNSYSDRTSRWFCDMLKSLGIYDIDDKHFDEEAVDIQIQRWLDRCYEPNGFGSLFTLNTPLDCRDIEIWKQAQMYINIMYNWR